MGWRRYIQYVAIPSAKAKDVPPEEYYSLPFEQSADLLGEVDREGYDYKNIEQAKNFIRNTYIKDMLNIMNFFGRSMVL